MGNLINEEINRIKLLYGYDSKKTLVENQQEVKEYLNEQVNFLKTLFKTGGRQSVRTAASEIDDILRSGGFVGGIQNTRGATLTSGDEIVRAIRNGEVSAANLGKINKKLLSTTKDLDIKSAIAQDIATTPNVVTKFSTMSEKDVLNNLINKTGHSSDDAKLIIQKYKQNGGVFKGEKLPSTTSYSKTRTTSSKATERNTRPVTKERFNERSFSYGKYGRTSGMSRAYYLIKTVGMAPGLIWSLMKLAAVVGIAYYIWKIFTENGKTGYPDCLSKNIPADDFEKMVDEGRDHILNTDTGNEFIDSNGGGKFYQSGKFETENGKFKGNWKEKPEVGIVVMTEDGTEYPISCEGLVEFDPITPETEVGTDQTIMNWDGTFNECSDFPMTLGCENIDIIGKVQRCLGLLEDGKFSIELLKKLQSNNYGNTLTQSVYDRIMSKCGMPEQESGFASSFI